MTAFADASAVVKLYAEEPGSQEVSRWRVLVVASVTRVEVSAALWRKQRLGELSTQDARTLVSAFLADWAAPGPDVPSYVPVAMSGPVADTAVMLCGTHGLRAYDAVQLASAMLARRADAGIDIFLATDKALLRAAAAEGFDVPEVGSRGWAPRGCR